MDKKYLIGSAVLITLICGYFFFGKNKELPEIELKEEVKKEGILTKEWRKCQGVEDFSGWWFMYKITGVDDFEEIYQSDPYFFDYQIYFFDQNIIYKYAQNQPINDIDVKNLHQKIKDNTFPKDNKFQIDNNGLVAVDYGGGSYQYLCDIFVKDYGGFKKGDIALSRKFGKDILVIKYFRKMK